MTRLTIYLMAIHWSLPQYSPLHLSDVQMRVIVTSFFLLHLSHGLMVSTADMQQIVRIGLYFLALSLLYFSHTLHRTALVKISTKNHVVR